MPGPAWHLYGKAAVKQTFDGILGSEQPHLRGRSNNIQVVLAIMGGEDVHQCLRCSRYFTHRRNANKHLRDIKDCHLSEYRLPVVNGKYFCFLDGQLFASKLELLYHLGSEHAEEAAKLRQWGLELKGVVAQASTMGVEEGRKSMLKSVKKKYVATSIKAAAIELIRRNRRDAQLRIRLRRPDLKRAKYASE